MGTLAPWAAAYLKQQRKQGRFTRGTTMRIGYTLSTLDHSFGRLHRVPYRPAGRLSS